MATAAPPLPPGYQLDQASTSTPPPLPPGYTLDSGQEAAPPPAAGPHVDMQKQDAFGNSEGKPVGDQLGDMVTGAAKGVAQVSTPGMIASFMQRFAPETAAKLPNVVKENTTSLSHLPAQIVQTAAPMMAGDEVPQASRTAEEAPKPTAAASDTPGVVSRLAKVGLKHVPGYGLASDIVDAIKGPEPEVPKQNFTPGPPEQWGQKIPTKEPDSTGSNKPYAGEKSPPPTQRGAIAEQMKPEAAPEATPAKPTIQRGVLQQQLEDALGAKKLQPNVPLKMQSQVPASAPEHMGQFARANGLDLHQAIPDSPSGDVLRAKIHDLSNVQVRQLAINAGEDMGQTPITNAKNSGGMTRQDALGRILAKHSPEEIGQMIDQGQHLPPVQRGALSDRVGSPVATTADPKMLLDRWGASEKSIADTDAQTRGKSSQESQQYIDQLAKSYKEGKPVEPVIEVRDADNNIISVDGRHRALAAKKAGVERIPIRVQRAQPTSK